MPHKKLSSGLLNDNPSLIEPLERRELLSLVIGVKLKSGSSSTITQVGQVVNMEVFATVKGSDSDPANDGLQTIIGSFLSTDVGGGVARGTLEATPTAPFDSFPPSTGGTQVDLDTDGDLDTGSNNDASAAGFFVARAGSVQSTNSHLNKFKIADLTFTVTQILTGTKTNVAFRVRQGSNGGLWSEDGQTLDSAHGAMTAGSGLDLTRVASSGPAKLASNGILTVKGNGNNNRITLSVKNNNVKVIVDDKTQLFNVARVKKIKISGNGGDDIITINKGVIATNIDGGDGDDSITGGNGNDTITGGNGLDTIHGGSGSDRILARDGFPDVVDGGSKTDTAQLDQRDDRTNLEVLL